MKNSFYSSQKTLITLFMGKYASCTAFLCILCFLLSACDSSPLSPKPTVTLSFWHVYGAQTHSPMNQLVKEFNHTVGKEHGVRIHVTSVSNSSAIHNALVAAAKKQPGSSEIPDLFACYPKTLEAMGKNLSLDWRKYFSADELKSFVPQFLHEGEFDGVLRVFPLAKSTNAFFINADAFEKFAKEAGVSYKDLATWEGVFSVTEKYHAWSGGKAFFMYDNWIQYPFLNMLSLGQNFFHGEILLWDNAEYLKMMRLLARAALKGEICLMPGFATKAIMIDAALAGVESSASVLYFKDTVTYSNNTKAPLRLQVLPEPRFKAAKRTDIQRGVGLVALQSTPEKEKAAALFCKWLVSSKKNLPFVIQGGYMPVRNDDFMTLNTKIAHIEFPLASYRLLYDVISELKENTTFVTAPTFEAYGNIEQVFSSALLEVFIKNRQAWMNGEDTLENLVDKSLKELQEKVSAAQKGK